MKMTFKKMTAIILVTTFFSNSSIAQDIASTTSNGMAVAKNEMTSIQNTGLNTIGKNSTDPGNTRLATKFAAMFPLAQNQQWAIVNKGYWVSFNNEGRKTRAGFNHNGQLNYLITECKTDQLSTELQNFISKNYAGYQLIHANEINAFGEQVQQAILENTSGFVTLNSTKDGIEELQKINKD